MAQWSRADRTLFAKLVYYGPAFGGKTTNLESLHRITDPRRTQKLLTVKTSDDRTLFFDLLPFDLGEILGYQVAIKLYTVPGQVRYEATRQVVLTGADAVVFVADSSTGREEQNRWSLQNLQLNMRAKRMDPGTVPIVFQFNKQDLADAAEPGEVAKWLKTKPSDGFAAVATTGDGVLETFMGACRTMLERLVVQADTRTRKEIDVDALGAQVDRAFAPLLARATAADFSAPADCEAPPIVLQGDDLLQDAIRASVRLGQDLTAEFDRRARLEREADAFRRLSESLREIGANFDRRAIVDHVLRTAREILGATAVSLLVRRPDDRLDADRVQGRRGEPLLQLDAGRSLLGRVMDTGKPCTVADLHKQIDGTDADADLGGVNALVAAPVGSGERAAVVAYGCEADGGFHREDVRFLTTLAGHLEVALEKVRLHDELARQRDSLEESVAARTAQLREAYEELRGLDRMKDRFLSNLSHEMKTPLTAILSSAVCLRDYKSNAKQRREMADAITGSGETLQRLLDSLLELAAVEKQPETLVPTETTCVELFREAIQLSGQEGVKQKVERGPTKIRIDLPKLSRAVANLIDNAVKFSGKPVELRARPAEIRVGSQEVQGLEISVLDRGPGVAPEQRESVFAAFEQGGNGLSDKPAGLGLGLYDARRIARQHGGDVCYVDRKGGGAEFRLTLPLQPVSESRETVVAHA